MLAKLNNPWSLTVPRTNNLFDEFFKFFENHNIADYYHDTPQQAINETDDEIQVTLYLPGYLVADFDIKVVSDFISIEAKREIPSLAEGEQYLRRERPVVNYKETFSLPAKVINNKVKAKYTDGVLTVTLPKQGVEKPCVIKVA
ncbi:MAG: Hsp20/alpha crystallin family protein [Victivallaceae bacterium]|nr:Hsp20/alpha crystallin family protein [Victivallaceae bacterium]